MSDTTRWGILGTGSIARKFAEGLASLPDAELAAVGSRTKESADAFADEFSIQRSHGSYAELVADPEVDAIYVATPHTLHKENALICLEAGKAVLCEKPFAINAGQAEEMVAAARSRGIFLMEAMWTRFLPAIEKVREWLSEGLIGEARMVNADFGFRSGWNPEGRLLNPELGGGALLDVGVYTISLASMVFGQPPSRIASMADIGQTGVDEQSAMVLGYDKGRLALLSCAVRTSTAQEAMIYGTEGSIRIHPPFWSTAGATLSVSGKDEVVANLPSPGNGYTCEAAEAGRCLREGRRESKVMPLDESIQIIKTMDQIREQWGLRYPME
jgi:dihydrodiol dehydrogenase / D-xylose 1-dehydrogenase (NADP)